HPHHLSPTSFSSTTPSPPHFYTLSLHDALPISLISLKLFKSINKTAFLSGLFIASRASLRAWRLFNCVKGSSKAIFESIDRSKYIAAHDINRISVKVPVTPINRPK